MCTIKAAVLDEDLSLKDEEKNHCNKQTVTVTQRTSFRRLI